MIQNFQDVKCDKCGGDGVVETGGIPTAPIPQMGYQSNKRELKDAVEKGGWKVSWSKDITETDAAEGIVAAGVSVLSENPAPFLEWINSIIDRTISSLESNAAQIGAELRGQMRDMAAETIRSAISGRSAKEIVRRLGQVDFKAGAIRYSGRNYLGDINVSRTWGMIPYVAIRWRQPNDISEPDHTPGIDSQNNSVDIDSLFDNTIKTYKVTLKTGDQPGAGTNADVFITVIGKNGIKQAVPLEKPGDDRERGDVDTYVFRCRNLGQITTVNIWHDNSGVRPGWYLKEVNITNVEDNKTWFFKCNNWLAVDEGDHRIGRTLNVSGQVE